MSKLFFATTLLVITMLLGMFGCGSDAGPPPPGPAEDPILKEKLLGSWNVKSINDGPPSTFLRSLIHEDLETSDPVNINKVGFKPEAPINGGNREGEVVDVTEVEAPEEHQVKINVNNFTCTFTADDSWTLHIQLSMVPNDETTHPPSSGVSQGADPGQGEQAPPPDNREQKPPPDNRKPPPDDREMLSGKIEVQGTWSGTYSITSDALLSLVVEEKDVNVTSDPEELLQKMSEITEKEAQRELHERFRIRLLRRISKTFITIEGETLNFEPPGSSPVKMLLEKQ